MKRILFVDDEPKILEGLQDLLRKYRHEMTMVFASGGESALAELGKSSFDVVISDMRMPGMDGAAFLERVKDDHPNIVRIVLSGHADRNAVFKVLPVCHQFLAKPCDAETLCNVIERSCKLQAVLTDSVLRQQVGSIEKLPSLSRTYRELMDAMSEPNVSTTAIARIIEQDSAMSAKLLQLVNSACFGTTRAISQIDRAVVYLGMELIRNLALTVQVFTTFAKGSAGLSFETLQRHAVRTARVAKRILPEQRSQQAFTAGLLHDVGHIALSVCNQQLYAEVVKTARASKRPLQEVESEFLGVTHAAVGAYLLGLWGLPFPIVEAVAYHHNPEAAGECTFDVTSAVAVADSLVYSLTGNEPSTLNLIHLESLKVLDRVPLWNEIAREEVKV